MTQNVLSVRDIRKMYGGGGPQRGIGVGVRGVSFELNRGEVIGLIGESGCGKTTLGRCIVRLDRPDSGKIVVGDVDISTLDGARLRKHRRRVQMVFQRPEMCLNPRMTIFTFVKQAIRNFNITKSGHEHEKIKELLTLVGLRGDVLNKYPHELSGGEKQRVAIMRALACDPDIIVLDEPTSALDVSVQAQVLMTIRKLQSSMGTSMIFISHDVAVVRYISSRVIIMYLGSIVEEGPSERVFSNPVHPYTQALLDAVPRLRAKEGRKVKLDGELVLGKVKSGECLMRVRCPLAHDRCMQAPPTFQVGEGHRVACWLAENYVDTSSNVSVKGNTSNDVV